MTVFFLDTFTDADGTSMVDHSPDVVPGVFAYTADASPGPTIQANRMVAGTGSSDVHGGYGLAWSLDFPYSITLVARNAPPPTGGHISGFTLSDDWGDPEGGGVWGENAIQVAVLASGFPTVTYYARLIVHLDGSDYAFAAIPMATGNIEHTLSLLVEEEQITLTIDGVAQTPIAFPLVPPPRTFSHMRVSLPTYAAGGASYIDRVEITQESPPPPATNPALPHITVPDGTPVFLAEGHAINEQSVFAQVPFITGHSRARRLLTVPMREVSAHWLFEADEMAAIDDWYENTLLAGTRQFSVQVRNQGSGPALLWWTARWIEFSTEMLNLGRGRAGGRLLLVGEGSEAGPELGILEAEITCALVDVRSNVYLPTPLATEISVALQQQPQQLAMDVLVALVEDYLPTGARLTEDGELRETEDGDLRVIN